VTRAQRAIHPILWLLVTAVALTVIVLAWRARPEPVPPSLPDAVADAVAVVIAAPADGER